MTGFVESKNSLNVLIRKLIYLNETTFISLYRIIEHNDNMEANLVLQSFWYHLFKSSKSWGFLEYFQNEKFSN